MDVGSDWAYLDSGVDPGPTWADPAFDDRELAGLRVHDADKPDGQPQLRAVARHVMRVGLGRGLTHDAVELHGLESCLHGRVDSRQHAAVVRAVIAVVEQADVPALAHRCQKLQQRSRALGKLEPVKHLVSQSRRMPADHVADVQLCGLVFGHINDRIVFFSEALNQFSAFFVAIA